MKSNLTENDFSEKSIWMTPHQLLEVPGMPESVPGIHYRANTQGWVKRKKEGVKGGKAVEYDVMSFPDFERQRVVEHLGIQQPQPTKEKFEDHPASDLSVNQALASALSTLVTELEPEEARKALKILSKGGLSALMPLIFEEEQLYKLMGATRQSIQTLMMLEALTPEARQEILSRYGSKEHSPNVAPDKEPHTKAG